MLVELLSVDRWGPISYTHTLQGYVIASLIASSVIKANLDMVKYIS